MHFDIGQTLQTFQEVKLCQANIIRNVLVHLNKYSRKAFYDICEQDPRNPIDLL